MINFIHKWTDIYLKQSSFVNFEDELDAVVNLERKIIVLHRLYVIIHNSANKPDNVHGETIFSS